MGNDRDGEREIGIILLWIALGGMAGTLLGWTIHTEYKDFSERLAVHLGYPTVTDLQPIGVAADLERLLRDIRAREVPEFLSFPDGVLAGKSLGSSIPNFLLFNIPEALDEPGRVLPLATLVGAATVAILVCGTRFILPRRGGLWVAVWSALWAFAVWRVAQPWWYYHKMERTVALTGGALGGAVIGVLFLAILAFRNLPEG
jgi:hypothetical protein